MALVVSVRLTVSRYVNELRAITFGEGFDESFRGQYELEPGFLARIEPFVGGLITFHFVSLGWVWFALSDPGLSLLVFRGLLGV